MCVAFLAITLGSLFAFPLWQRALGNPVLVFLSTISYNLYLWHQPIARALLVAHVPPWIGASEHNDPVWGLRYSFVAVAAGLVVATAVTFGVERPLLRRRPFEPRVERSVSALADAM
jgi:peptidoglycan/LPS O-acetylase OafA/YrhL